MCRNIKTLFNFDPPATDEEVRAASLQFVRKLSGFTQPSKANEAAFARAVDEVFVVARRLIDSLETAAPPKDRATEAARARGGVQMYRHAKASAFGCHDTEQVVLQNLVIGIGRRARAVGALRLGGIGGFEIERAQVGCLEFFGQRAAGLVALAGIGIVAMPTGILASAFAEEFRERHEREQQRDAAE